MTWEHSWPTSQHARMDQMPATKALVIIARACLSMKTWLRCADIYATIACYLLSQDACQYSTLNRSGTPIFAMFTQSYSPSHILQDKVEKLQSFLWPANKMCLWTSCWHSQWVMKTLFVKVLWMFKTYIKKIILKERSIWSFCKHYGNVTFECSLNILKQVTFRPTYN